MVKLRVRSIEAGMTLSEVYKLVRGERIIRAVQAKSTKPEGASAAEMLAKGETG